MSSLKTAQLVEVARQALPAPDADVAREAIGWDLALLGEIDRHLDLAARHLEWVLPDTPCPSEGSQPSWAP